ncbi:MAG: flagellar biosynthesis anti-sigma factor FlgM [Nitrospinales bacterium]
MEIPGNELSRKVGQQKVVGKPSVKKDGGAPAAADSKPVSGQPVAEQVSVSSKARDIQRAHEVIKSSPDIRTEKVNRIKQAIADGTFKVDSEKLAGKILEDIITQSAFLK